MYQRISVQAVVSDNVEHNPAVSRSEFADAESTPTAFRRQVVAVPLVGGKTLKCDEFGAFQQVIAKNNSTTSSVTIEFYPDSGFVAELVIGPGEILVLTDVDRASSPNLGFSGVTAALEIDVWIAGT